MWNGLLYTLDVYQPNDMICYATWRIDNRILAKFTSKEAALHFEEIAYLYSFDDYYDMVHAYIDHRRGSG